MDWDAVAAAGLYDPEAQGADTRRELIELLASCGATVEQMVGAIEIGELCRPPRFRRVRQSGCWRSDSSTIRS